MRRDRREEYRSYGTAQPKPVVMFPNNPVTIVCVFLRSTGWLALCGGFLYAIMLVELDWNFFYWKPNLNGDIVAAVFMQLGTLTGMFLLARTDRSLGTRILSGIVCFLVAVFGAILVYEEITRADGFLVPSTPWWYQVCRSVLTLLPMAVWYRGTIRDRPLILPQEGKMTRP